MWRNPNPATVGVADGRCSEWREMLVLFAAGDELDPVQLTRLTDHLGRCSDCSAALDQEKKFLEVLREHRVEPDGALLASCRASIEDALDREEEGGWLRRKVGVLLPSSWLSPQPAWSAALLVLIGFSVGMFGPRFLRHPVEMSSPVPNSHASYAIHSDASDPASPAPTSAPSKLDLHTAELAGINVSPADGIEPPQVELQMMAREPITVQGTVDDDSVKRVLLYVLHNSERFDPDVRLNAVDLLRQRTEDPEIRAALCQAVRSDGNAAVRLKALEAINGARAQEIVRNTLLDALVDDRNPGVRVEAINSLREMVEKGEVVSDDHVLAVLRDRMRHDPNTYIRIESAAAIRDLSPAKK